MKEILRSIGRVFLIILPLILIISFIYNFIYYRNELLVTNDNVNIIKEYLEKNEIKVKSNIKQIAVVGGSKLAYTKFEILYDDDEIEIFSIETLTDNDDFGLSQYIVKNGTLNFNLPLRIIIIIISSIISICLIDDTGKKREIDERDY